MNRKQHIKHRSGTIYLTVVGVTLIVGMMAAGGIAIARLELRMSRNAAQQQEARLLAISAVEYGTQWINQTPDWRTTLTIDTETTPFLLGNNGTCSWMVNDPDGDLDDDHTDTVELIGYGRVGDAIAMQRVVLEPDSGVPVTSLEAALHCNGNIAVTSTVDHHIINTNQTISSNGEIDASGLNNSINGDTWAVGTIVGNISGARDEFQTPPREMPGSSVFDYYKANGTWIDITDLPTSSGFRKISKTLLSPANNPWGETNAEGIYVIDCQGEKICIENSRIVGTLVLINPGADSSTTVINFFQPAVTNYPILMVEGNFGLIVRNYPLSEGFPLNVNFNPVGTPYLGVEDSDTSDSYPGEMQGLIYISGTADISFTATPMIVGGLVCGQIVLDAPATFDYESTYYDNPPPGFNVGSQMRVIPSSWEVTGTP